MHIAIAIQFQYVRFCSSFFLQSALGCYAQRIVQAQTFNYLMHRIQVKTRIKKKMNQILLKIIVQHNDASGVICYDPDDREKNMRKFHNKITVAIKIHGKATNDVCTFRVSNRIRVVENTRRLHHIELPVKCASDHMRAQSDRRMYVFHCGKRSTFQMYFAGFFFFFLLLFFFFSVSFIT